MRFGAAVIFALAGATPLLARTVALQTPRPIFTAGVDRVTVTAVVHKRNGQPVTDLKREDFDVLDDGQVRPILEFRSEPTPATVALLVDYSGSMNVALKMQATRTATADIVAGLTPGADRVGLFVFDSQIHQLMNWTPAPGDVLHQFDRLRPFGKTSMLDAVAETAKLLAAEGSTRRAVVVVTDGGENSSHLGVSDVMRIANEIDVPVYIVVIVSPLDREGTTKAETTATATALSDGRLGNLAHWTGGELFFAPNEIAAKTAADQIVTELRHQYFIGFAPDAGRPGWHPIDIRPRQKDLIVRARSGYIAQ